MSKYIITLKPTDAYFFGQEIVRVLGNKQSYFQHSADLPQQTTLLGMLRYQILKQNKQIPLKNYSLACKLVGKKSFIVGNDSNVDFGVIKSISPLFLIEEDDENNPYFLFDKRFSKSEENLQSLFIEESSKCDVVNGFNLYNRKAYILKSDDNNIYSPKDGFWSGYMDLGNDSNKIDTGELFKSQIKVGINKNSNGAILDNAFYKMEYKMMEKHWAMAFIADVDCTEMEFLRECEDFAFMGKERSLFRMSVKKVNENKLADKIERCDKIPTNNNSDEIFRVTFLSDCFVEDEKDFYNNSLFANIETVHFRNLSYIMEEGNNYSEKPTKSRGYNLIKRGSEVFTNEIQSLNNIIKGGHISKQFYKIGYNHTLIEKMNK